MKPYKEIVRWTAVTLDNYGKHKVVLKSLNREDAVEEAMDMVFRINQTNNAALSHIRSEYGVTKLIKVFYFNCVYFIENEHLLDKPEE